MNIFANSAFTRIAAAVTVAAGMLTATAAQSYESDAFNRYEAAIEACADESFYAPVTVVEAVGDGLGDLLVWLEDRNGDLWMCNADAWGTVYVNVLIEGDLLNGSGLSLVGWQDDIPVDGQRPNPQFEAERLCMAVVDRHHAETTVWTTAVADGMGDYLVWLETEEGSLWACNASASGILFALEPIDEADDLPMA